MEPENNIPMFSPYVEEAVTSPVVDPDLNPMNCLVTDDGFGNLTVEHVPDGWFYDRRLLLHGINWEHVSEDEHGRWVYRHMK